LARGYTPRSAEKRWFLGRTTVVDLAVVFLTRVSYCDSLIQSKGVVK